MTAVLRDEGAPCAHAWSAPVRQPRAIGQAWTDAHVAVVPSWSKRSSCVQFTFSCSLSSHFGGRVRRNASSPRFSDPVSSETRSGAGGNAARTTATTPGADLPNRQIRTTLSRSPARYCGRRQPASTDECSLAAERILDRQYSCWIGNGPPSVEASLDVGAGRQSAILSGANDA